LPEVMSAAAPASFEARPRRLARGEALVGLLLSLPAGVAYFLMLLLPSLATILLAFTDYELGALEWGWIGAANFEEMLADRGFAVALRNTVIYVGFVTPLSILLGLGVALLIEAGIRGRALFRAVFFLPVVSLTVAMAAAWQYLLHPTIGPLNASSDWVLLSLGAIGTWENIGYNMVLFLAGLSAIPRELYHAAEVDGTKTWLDRFRLVTWPMLGPTTLFVLTITMIRSIRVFDTVAVLTQGGPNKASEVLLHTMYKEGFTFMRLGYSAAITLVFLMMVLGLVWLQTKALDKRVHYG
jgi:multiple sugar transport system permease protein